MSQPLILVTGEAGQLGDSIKKLTHLYPQFNFYFPSLAEFDLSKPENVAAFILDNQPEVVINCAAYTAVDKAETEQEICLKINALSVAEMAKACKQLGATLITISTDYVFDGNGTSPYLPNHPIDPVNYYGYTKAQMEKLALENHQNTIIIRTSWVYCEFGHNFVKTMLRLMNEKPALSVVDDQVGCPTYAPDLAKAILKVVEQLDENKHRGIYHFSNTGNISWFEFATAIRDIASLPCEVNPVPSTAYPTPAKRPSYSTMETSAITKDFGVEITDWKESLQTCIHHLMA